MTEDDIDKIPWVNEPAQLALAHPRRWKHGHRYIEDGTCAICHKTADQIDANSRRGLNNRARGNRIELGVARQLGLSRVGQYGGAEDAGRHDEPFIVQVKSGGPFSEKYWRWLKALPANAAQTALLVVTDAPGPGHRRRAYVVVDMDDWIALHGTAGIEE